MYEFTQTPDYGNLKNILHEELSPETKLDWERILEPIVDKMSVSIDVLDNDN